ncbi:head-tail connector protein [Acinetobacter sp. NIPH1876]|uniref:head-tail connector protein n=1 Tax=unclassified Acinetobacter TaxID=196816 RepID=UPI001FACD48A|nr:head-tail connector protein [Acinetobacter sp. NIPH1876]MCJ0828695.1 head-tail connector protein [Acinetobacter sp. NIPH1876]
MSIVTLEEAKGHLRYDDDSNDTELQIYLDSAESTILRYVDEEHRVEPYPKEFRSAVLLYVGYFDKYRNAESDAPVNGNFMPQPVQALLFTYRTPTAV